MSLVALGRSALNRAVKQPAILAPLVQSRLGSSAAVTNKWFEDHKADVPPRHTPVISRDYSRFVGMTGGQIFHEMMLEHKVDTVFGYPGGAILPVFDAIHASPHFKFYLPRHEQGGGHMAEGYARVTGKPGVVLVTSGPGATNTVTPLQDALMDGVPLVVFSGQVPTHLMGSDAFQEADTLGITRSCTKWNVLVKDIRDLPRRIDEAFEIAMSGRPGPVLVDLPKDVTAGVCKAQPFPRHELPFRAFQRPEAGFAMTADKWENVAKMINNAERPLIYAGQGIISSDASKELAMLAELGNIPVTTTLQGMGGFDELDSKSVHMLGMHGSAYANYTIQDSDCIIALGARFDDRVTGNLQKFAPAAFKAERDGKGGIIHFEISRKNVNKVLNCTEVVMGDVKVNLKKLLPMIKRSERAPWFAKIAQWKKDFPFNYSKTPGPSGALRPQKVIDELNTIVQKIDNPTYFTTGVGQHQMWAAQYIRWRYPRTFITSGGLGTMGFGLPAAIGAKTALPNNIVIDIDGDASFSMTSMELMTAAEYGIGVKVLLLNNNFQGMVKQWQDLFYDERYSGTKMFNPNFAKLAEASGVRGMTLDSSMNVQEVLQEFIDHEGPVVLDCIIEKDEHVYPMVPAGAGLHEMTLRAK
ncbi:acetolactate synthase, mitochondrial [Sphaeroforma arctica JP610]|uniref:Acetolactate synthase n=1 Tax=Sphaeroforma arctica JP610 TaxID=667725 RepID=A0A0L0FNF8_9EUKA|nr:acetolactate synthase, mitochondrial [Sphaeroforma arctica JP610]KNC77543.1 acetolactate synthase, mitochondrial [Sphaeroforma arctica JP610]|eukprot:XP_014151445.1 acetolactate synthase, mitochondrial [Sphaeroforma arctica JP610]